MKDAQRKIDLPAVLALPAQDVRTLLEAGNGDAALLYRHILRNGGILDEDRAALELHRSDRDIETAAQRLCRMGLLSGAPAGAPERSAPRPAEELPRYGAGDVARRSQEDPRFQELVSEVQMALGRIDLTRPDLNRLFGIYSDLAMPPEVILLLIQYCKEETEARYGKDRRVGFAFIEKVAYEWFHREILTCEQAEQWLGRQALRRTQIGEIRQALGLYDQKLTPTVRQFLTEWLELGFSPEAILQAADITMTNTNGLKWRYMDGILRSWDQKGLHTPEEIRAGDRKPAARGTGKPAAGPRDESKTMEQVNRLREKMKNS